MTEFLGRYRENSCGLAIFFVLALAKPSPGSDFRFHRDTFAFANETVFEYRDGVAHWRKPSTGGEHVRRYTSRCFVMTRAAMQFHKFARFNPHGAPADDRTLTAQIRQIVRRSAWREPLPPDQRIVVAGYPNLRTLSRTRGRLLQDNIGAGWTAYFRLGNSRMLHEHSREYQERTQADLEATLARGELFVAYLSTFPNLNINHAVLVYGHKRSPGAKKTKLMSYVVYDPNHPEAPRELTWSPAGRFFAFQKDWDFVGGFVRVYRVYGKPIQ